MKIIKNVFAILGLIFICIIIYLFGFICGIKSGKDLGQKYISELINQVLTYQLIINQLDESNIDSTRYLLTDYQDREILGMYLESGNIKDNRYKEHVKSTLRMIAEHRMKHSNIYYVNKDGLVPANIKVNDYLKASLSDDNGKQ